MKELPGLDILLYAHDGRGLGHVSRSVAIGLALRRLYPKLKVALVTGCRFTQEMIVSAPLDWFKLPAYETVVLEGKSRGATGPAGFEDTSLGLLRQRQLEDLVRLYKPRLLLVDHSPQGKHKELLPALARLRDQGNCTCILGVRGIVGDVHQVGSEISRNCFASYYSHLFWYGDSTVLGDEPRRRLEKEFNCQPFECGYVSRFSEWKHRAAPQDSGGGQSPYAIISIPWLGEHTGQFLDRLNPVIKEIGAEKFRLFAGADVRTHLAGRCAFPAGAVEAFGAGFFPALLNARVAVIYGGYNSIVDVLSCEIPAAVVLREMADAEQQRHLKALGATFSHQGRLLQVNETQTDVGEIREFLVRGLACSPGSGFSTPVRLDGAQVAAARLTEILGESISA